MAVAPQPLDPPVLRPASDLHVPPLTTASWHAPHTQDPQSRDKRTQPAPLNFTHLGAIRLVDLQTDLRWVAEQAAKDGSPSGYRLHHVSTIVLSLPAAPTRGWRAAITDQQARTVGWVDLERKPSHTALIWDQGRQRVMQTPSCGFEVTVLDPKNQPIRQFSLGCEPPLEAPPPS